MPGTAKPKQNPKRDLLIGTWRNGDEYLSDVEFTITRRARQYAVEVRDGFDGEHAEVFDVKWNGHDLSFAAHWKSTGRFARYALCLLSLNRLDVTYTYTDTEMYHRKPSKRR